ncbi:DNA cytosine methyltransferase [Viscerimonas tarda]
MIGFDIFSGAGGMSLGASLAGVDVKVAIDIDKWASDTYRLNHKNTYMINADIRKIIELPIKKDNKQTVLFGGPPCQGFSFSNQRTRNKENGKNWLFLEFIRITKLFNPDWIVLENVSGIQKTEKGFFLEQICDQFKNIGYTINHQLLNAVNFGVPQKRERFFLVGSKNGVSYEFPIGSNENIVSVYDAISDLPSLENGASDFCLDYKEFDNLSEYATNRRGTSLYSYNNSVSKNTQSVLDRYQYIPQGGNWSNIPEELMTNYKDCSRCHGGIYHRLMGNKPSVVIGNYRKNMLIHPNENRGLSVREAARLQSFPDSYIFSGHLTEQQQQVGNAVPPLLAKAVFEKLIKL